MKLVIVGAGGVGCFFGGLLARGGQTVSFLARRAQLDALRTNGIRIDSLLLGQVATGPVHATDDPREIGIADVVLVCVKAHQVEGALDSVAPLVGPDTLVLSLQNGLEADGLLAQRFGREQVVATVVYVGATIEEPGVVRHVAAGRIVMGARPWIDAGRLSAARDALASSGQPIDISERIDEERWRKLVWNAAFNSVCAVTGKVPRDLLAMPPARDLLVGIMHEVIAVARAEGVMLAPDEADAAVRWTEGAPAIQTSTQIDRQRGREMEADALVGVLVRKGRAAGVPTPLAATMYALMRAIDTPA